MKRKLLIFAIILGMLLQTSSPVAAATSGSHEASFIKQVTDVLMPNIKEFFDSNAAFQLADFIQDDDEISVIITVDTASIMDAYEGSDKTMSLSDFIIYSPEGKAITAEIADKKADVLSRLDEKGIKYELGDDYTTILSGFEVRIKAGDFKTTCKSLKDGEDAIVCEVYKTADAKVVENNININGDTGIINSSLSGYDGSGMVVAVLDTGIDYNHSAFSMDNFTSTTLGLTYDQVAAVVGNTVASTLMSGLTVDDVFVSNKIPYMFDYADEDADSYSTHNNHGTHVSGVIAGKDDTITGVAPNAQIVSMKIFSDVQDTAMASWILSALEDCVVLGVDVINMSIGTACGFGRESDEEKLNGVYDKIRAAGINVIVAASNSYSSAYGSEANGNLGLTSNPDTGTVGSPSTYEGMLSIASISGTKTPYLLYNKEIIYFIESNNRSNEENHFCDTLLGDKESVEIEYVVIPGVGRTADYTGLDVEGKIVLVRRGSNTFEEKAIIAEQQGAAGIIIYNNVSGDIKMNVGDAKLAVCSISQDNGEMLAAAGGGKIKIAKSQAAGPFISDFSSWGPTPSLGIKPELTSFGGNILSSVTGGGYERLSGTSMATPNLSGVALILRQYVRENFPEIANDDVAVTAFIYQLLMSTADIALNTNGLPYAVRKQGAGLANLDSALATLGYITTKDANGKVMDKTKIELGDDRDKTGVYEMSFTVHNFGDKKLSYEIGSYVMTEGVSDTKTSAGKTTVTEEAYILDGATFEIISVEGGKLSGQRITVDPDGAAEVTVKITLGDKDKEYLDNSFENGMYVEGFITLTAKSGTKVNLSVPYLAFYGDWTKAPLFDLTYFDTNKDEIDPGIDDEDKTKADAYPTRPIGGMQDDYVSYLGTYYFLQNPSDMQIAADMDHISLSKMEGTIHSLRFLWTGLLRNAAQIKIEVINDVTGEVIYETIDYDVRKSYGDGGSIYPANVEIEFDVFDYNLANNTELTVRATGLMDYGQDGGLETNLNNVYEFPITVDFEAPTVTGVKYTYEYDKTLGKNRLYAEVAVYDNHYAMAAQFGFVKMGEDENQNPTPEMELFEQYLTPIYSQRNGTTYVKYELTDYVNNIKENSINANSFIVTTYDYALNYATYEIGLPDDFSDFYFDGLEDEITISQNEVFSLDPIVEPATEWSELLEVTSSKPSVVRVVNNKLVGVKKGSALVKVQDPTTNKSKTFKVTVLADGDEGYTRYDKPVADVFSLNGFYTSKAYYMLDSKDKLIGDTGSTNFFGGNYSLSMYPSESLYLLYTLDSYFPQDTTVEFESSNESIVTIDASGHVVAVAEGFASVTIKVLMDGKSTYYSETVSVEVKDPYVTQGATLSHYYGNGGLVVIPADLKLNTIGAFAFSNYDYIAKTPEELEIDDRETSKQWFIGEGTITKVIIPEGVKKIEAYAFANLVALEEIVLPSTLEAIEYGAFYGCSSLKKITFSGEDNVVVINQSAFEGCALEGTLEWKSVNVISNYAFAGNTKLQGLVLGENVISIGSYAFAGCAGLKEVSIASGKVKYGTYAFTGCKSLTEFYVNSSVLPEGMFYECEKLESITIGKDVNDIGEFAFRDTVIKNFIIETGNTAYKVQTADYILSADGKTLVAVSPLMDGEFSKADIDNNEVTALATGALSHNTEITSVVLPNVTVIGDYGLASNKNLESYEFGALEKIGEYAFFETGITEVPAFTKDTQIGKYAFAFTQITNVNIPDGTVLAEGVFSECMKLQKVVIGNDVTIGKYAFAVDKDNSFIVKNYNEGKNKYFYYDFATALTEVVIGENVVIGDHAFAYAASLERVDLGAGAVIGYMSFYGTQSLTDIDLSQVTTIGDYAFSGDVYNICIDENMAFQAVSKDGNYIYTYHGPALTQIDLSSATSIGEHAFSYCRELITVILGEEITEIPQYAFAGDIALEEVNLDKVESIGDYAFMETGLKKVDLTTVEEIGKYAFVNLLELEELILNPEGSKIEEGAFAYCEELEEVENLNAVESIGDYAFAYTAITNVDLTGAEHVGTHAFLKEELTPFTVIFGEDLESLGDNPFGMCQIDPFFIMDVEEINDREIEIKVYTFEISDTVKVVDGSLYCKVDNGWELITYAGINSEDVEIPEDTVRISAMAFAGSDVKMVELPYTTTSIGHKAFYDCKNLEVVIFGSFTAPILEEEYDPAHYESFTNIPGTGDFGTYEDWEGNEVSITGMGLVPYFMWNATGGLYSNVFYGANFVDYVGYVENKLTMIAPVNGKNYDSYIYQNYFDVIIDGKAAPDEITVAAIQAIKAIPAKVTYEERALVEYARAAYSKIATLEQQSLVSNYADLITAEQRILALTPTDEPVEGGEEETPDNNNGAVIWGVVIVFVAVVAAVAVVVISKKKSAEAEDASVDQGENNETEN